MSNDGVHRTRTRAGTYHVGHPLRHGHCVELLKDRLLRQLELLKLSTCAYD